MTRKLAYVGFSCMAGYMAASFIGFLPSAAAAVVLAAAAVIIIFIGRSKKLMTAVVCLVFFSLGLASYSAYDEQLKLRSEEYSCADVGFTGIVKSIDSISGDRFAYTLKGRVNDDFSAGVLLYSGRLDAEIGDELTFFGRLKKPEDTYTFSAEKYYKSRGIFFTADSSDVTVRRVEGFSLLRVCDRYGSYIRELISGTLRSDEGDFLTAMLLGDRSKLDSNLKQSVYRAGFGHIMAVSGIHLTVIAVFLRKLLEKLTPFDKREIFIVSVFPLLAFCLMSGMSISVMRAFIMLMIVGAADLFGRQSDTMNSLGLAGLVLTAANPYAVRDSGLILSFAGVIAVGVVAPKLAEKTEELFKGRLKSHKPLKNFLRNFLSALCVFVFLFPFSVLIFDEASVVSPITNIVFVPLCTAALILCAAAAFFGWQKAIACIFIKLAGIIVKPALAFARFVSSCRGLYIPTGHTAPRFIISAALAVTVLMLLFRCDIIRTVTFSMISAVICIASVYISRAALAEHTFVTYIASGKSSVVIIKYGGRAAVIDIKNGSSCAEKYLLRSGVYAVDTVMLTDNAASEAAEYVDRFAEFDIASFYCPEEAFIGSGTLESSGLVRYYSSDTAITNEHYTIYPHQNGDISADICGCGFTISDSGEFYTADGIGYDGCCIEYDIYDNNAVGRLIFVGGDN